MKFQFFGFNGFKGLLQVSYSQGKLHWQNKMNAKKIISLALTVAILPNGVWF